MKREEPDVTIHVRVSPRSSRSEIGESVDGVFRVKLRSPPVDGAANAELVKLLAERLGVSRSSVTIVSGETSRTKRVRISGVSALDVENRLL